MKTILRRYILLRQGYDSLTICRKRAGPEGNQVMTQEEILDRIDKDHLSEDAFLVFDLHDKKTIRTFKEIV